MHLVNGLYLFFEDLDRIFDLHRKQGEVEINNVLQHKEAFENRFWMQTLK